VPQIQKSFVRKTAFLNQAIGHEALTAKRGCGLKLAEHAQVRAIRLNAL
jgi:hypothetical protein